MVLQFHTEGRGCDVGDPRRLHLLHVCRPGSRRVPDAAAGEAGGAEAGRRCRCTLQTVAIPRRRSVGGGTPGRPAPRATHHDPRLASRSSPYSALPA